MTVSPLGSLLCVIGQIERARRAGGQGDAGERRRVKPACMRRRLASAASSTKLHIARDSAVGPSGPGGELVGSGRRLIRNHDEMPDPSNLRSRPGTGPDTSVVVGMARPFCAAWRRCGSGSCSAKGNDEPPSISYSEFYTLAEEGKVAAVTISRTIGFGAADEQAADVDGRHDPRLSHRRCRPRQDAELLPLLREKKVDSPRAQRRAALRASAAC